MSRNGIRRKLLFSARSSTESVDSGQDHDDEDHLLEEVKIPFFKFNNHNKIYGTRTVHVCTCNCNETMCTLVNVMCIYCT